MTAATAPLPCPAGSYSSVNGTTTAGPGPSFPSCIVCPAGSRCTLGSTTPVPCGVGSYSSSAQSSCVQCPAGRYCGSTTSTNVTVFTGGMVWANNGDAAGGCFAGTLCAAGMIRAPDLTRDACPQGYYCPAATPAATPCPAGRYGANTGLAALTDCTITPAGKYSIAAATAPSGLCRPGYYCPAQSTSNTSLACPAGRYNAAYGAANSTFCSLCVAGGYCSLHSALPLVCPAGYYCPTGASAGSACRPGTYSTTLGLISVDQCLPCTGGYFCNGQALTAPTGVCAAGYYCYSGSNSSTPSSPYSATAVVTFSGAVIGGAGSAVGGICPRGYYCPQNTAVPSPCAAGTFSNGTRQVI